MSSVIIHGLGLSGMSALKYHLSVGYDVYFIEYSLEKSTKALSLGAKKYDEDDKLNDVNYVIKSPGIPLDNKDTISLFNAGYKITSDICVFIDVLKSKFKDASVIGVTGTNGKSTTACLINHMLNFNGIESYVGGNYGIPVFDIPMKNATYILELSSYQLEISDDLPLSIAVWTNISADHIKFHGSMSNYCKSKEKIFQNAENIVISIDDYISKNIAIKFSESDIKTVLSSKNDVHPYDKFKNLKGEHNHQNISLSFNVGRILKIPVERVYESFESFPGLRHRQHCVYENKNIKCINDSKATNVSSCISALKVFDNIHLILGGSYKGESFYPISEYSEKIKMIYIIGENPNKILDALKDSGVNIPYVVSGDMDRAVNCAYDNINKGEGGDVSTLLLSPACASFDQYENFEKRGEHFEGVVSKLIC